MIGGFKCHSWQFKATLLCYFCRVFRNEQRTESKSSVEISFCKSILMWPTKVAEW